MSWKTWLILLVVLATLGTGACLGFSQFDRLCTELAVNHFRVRPSAVGAATLAKLVDDQTATPKQVKRILPLLFTPKVTTEAAYPLGGTPTVRVELPFEVVLQNLVVEVDEFIWINEQRRSGTRAAGIHTLRENPHSLSFRPTPSKPGAYTMEIRYTYRLRLERKRTWQWNPVKGIILPRRAFVNVPKSAQSKPRYECSIIVPVEIVVVDTGRTSP